MQEDQEQGHRCWSDSAAMMGWRASDGQTWLLVKRSSHM